MSTSYIEKVLKAFDDHYEKHIEFLLHFLYHNEQRLKKNALLEDLCD